MAKLTLVGTTIGNVEDISIRALRAIFESPIILAEDTRVITKFKRILIDRYLETLGSLEIKYETDQILSSYREQNHKRVILKLINLLKEGNDIVYFSDAGMPGISDPGYELVRDVLYAGFEVDVIPGPTAVSTALVVSGLPTDRYTFLGFLPRRKSRIIKLLKTHIDNGVTVIFYESPFRLLKTLKTIKESDLDLEGLQVAVCGELTKKFQRVERGEISEVIEKLESQKPRGEWVVCVRKMSE